MGFDEETVAQGVVSKRSSIKGSPVDLLVVTVAMQTLFRFFRHPLAEAHSDFPSHRSINIIHLNVALELDVLVLRVEHDTIDGVVVGFEGVNKFDSVPCVSGNDLKHFIKGFYLSMSVYSYTPLVKVIS
jgi:hypothetical protein